MKNLGWLVITQMFLLVPVLILLGCSSLPVGQSPTPVIGAASPIREVTATPPSATLLTYTPIITSTIILSSTHTPVFIYTPTKTLASIPPSTRTPTPTATETRVVMCTPPACKSNETYSCPGVCPGGCGTQCATKTPTPEKPASLFSIPSAPTNFVAIGSGNTVTISLDDNSTIEQGYHIYQVGLGNPIGQFTTVDSPGTGHRTFRLDTLSCNFSGALYARAYSPSGISEASNTSSVVTVPCAPTNFAILSATRMGSLYISLTDNALNETGFRIYRADSATPVTTLYAWSGAGKSSTTAIGVFPCGTQGNYFVRAYNSAGESLDSNLAVGINFPCK